LSHPRKGSGSRPAVTGCGINYRECKRCVAHETGSFRWGYALAGFCSWVVTAESRWAAFGPAKVLSIG